MKNHLLIQTALHRLLWQPSLLPGLIDKYEEYQRRSHNRG